MSTNKEGTMAEKTEAEFSDNDRIAYCECGFFWTVPTGMPWRDCENCDEAPIDLIASYKALAQQDQGWEARRFTDGTGLFGVYHPAGTWQVGCQTPDRAQAEAWAAALNEGRPIQQDQESSGEGRRRDKAPCETCGGQPMVNVNPFSSEYEPGAPMPCPTCTTEKQGEAEER